MAELDPHVTSKATALWSGVAAFFSSLLAIGVFDVFNVDGLVEFTGALIVAILTAGAIYSKERLTLARHEGEAKPATPPPSGPMARQ